MHAQDFFYLLETSPVHGDPFEPLANALNRLPHLSRHWSRILKNWIVRCEGFLDDAYFYESDPTASHLVQHTVRLLDALPLTITDVQLCQRLSEDFEGLFLHAKVDEQLWNSIQMPYATFKRLHQALPDNQIDVVAHCPSTHVYSWLTQQLPDYA